jgi:hypothetical protein
MSSTIQQHPSQPTAVTAAWANELKASLKVKALPVPEEALDRLAVAARGDTGQSQVCRFFLFWLAGLEDPTGFKGEGALELRRLDQPLKEQALQVLTWWMGPTQSDSPLYSRLELLRRQFAPGGSR